MKKMVCILIVLLICSCALAEPSIDEIAALYDEKLTGTWKCISGVSSETSILGLHDSDGIFSYGTDNTTIKVGNVYTSIAANICTVSVSLDGSAYLLWGDWPGTLSWSGEISISGDGKYLRVKDELNNRLSIYEKTN